MISLHQTTRKLKRNLGAIACRSVLYNWTLGGPDAPLHFAVHPPACPWPGNAAQGRTLAAGSFQLGQENVLWSPGHWLPVGLDPLWIKHIHSFDWLRDLRTLGGDTGRQTARMMIDDWIDHFYGWDDTCWQPCLSGRRLVNWLSLYDFFGASADESFQIGFFESTLRQARHLARVVPGDLDGLDLLYGAAGLIYVGTVLPGYENWLVQGIEIYTKALEKQILSDGMHVSRSPKVLIKIMQLTADLRTLLQTADYPVPAIFVQTSDRMAQALRFFRLFDQKMPSLNGLQENDGLVSDMLLASYTQARHKIVKELPASGYERLTCGRSLLMIDAGNSPAWPHDFHASAAPLSFEFSCGKERIFVSCGHHPASSEWQSMLRNTAAHNALSLDERNAAEIRADGHISRKARILNRSRIDDNAASFFEATHDGYVKINGMSHKRSFYLGHHGHDFRGEDIIFSDSVPPAPVNVAIRFHLHPKVLVSPIQDGAEALLRLPSGSGWRFKHSGGALKIEDSIYLGDQGIIRRTKQLVIYGQANGNQAKLKWALQREMR